MPSKRRRWLKPDTHPIGAERLIYIRSLAQRAVGSAKSSEVQAAINSANHELSRFERGYFVAWRDGIALATSA